MTRGVLPDRQASKRARMPPGSKRASFCLRSASALTFLAWRQPRPQKLVSIVAHNVINIGEIERQVLLDDFLGGSAVAKSPDYGVQRYPRSADSN
jgi:hypothetical protein